MYYQYLYRYPLPTTYYLRYATYYGLDSNYYPLSTTHYVLLTTYYLLLSVRAVCTAVHRLHGPLIFSQRLQVCVRNVRCSWSNLAARGHLSLSVICPCSGLACLLVRGCNQGAQTESKRSRACGE